jgi:hypothetical protein
VSIERQTPDYCEPLIGYRYWTWDPVNQCLRSLYNGERWHPYRALQARCVDAIRNSPAAPAPDCHCGVYAFCDEREAVEQRPNSHVASPATLIFGSVWLWGTVVQHVKGWRAQFAYPRSLTSSLAASQYGVDTHHDYTLPRYISERDIRRGRWEPV